MTVPGDAQGRLGHEPPEESALVSYRGVSWSALERLWQRIEGEKEARGVRLVTVKRDAQSDKGRDKDRSKRAGGKVSTARIVEKQRDGRLVCHIPYVGEVQVRQEAASPKDRKAWTMEDVLQNVVLAKTKSSRAIYSLTELEKGSLGSKFEGVYVSVCRSAIFGDVMKALEALATANDGPQYFWLDIFCTSIPGMQSPKGEEVAIRSLFLDKHLHCAINEFERFVIHLSTWSRLPFLHRAWSAWELYGALHNRKPIVRIFPTKTGEVALAQALVDDVSLVQSLRVNPKLLKSANQRDMKFIQQKLSVSVSACAEIQGYLAKLMADAAPFIVRERRRDPRTKKKAMMVMWKLTTALRRHITSVEDQIAITEKILASYEVSPETILARADAWHTLGDALELKGDRAGAKTRFMEALNVYETNLGKSHPNAARLQFRLIGLLPLHKRLDEYEVLLELYESMGEKNHKEDFGDVWFQMARTLKDMRDNQEAIEKFHKAIEIWGPVSGEGKGIKVAQALTAIARLELHRGDDLKSIKNFEAAISTYAKVHGGRENLDVANTLARLSKAYVSNHDYGSAANSLKEAGHILEVVYGTRFHHEVGISKFNLGYALKADGKIPEAIKQFQEAREIYTETFGPNHIRVANLLFLIGELLQRDHKYEEATKVLEEALEAYIIVHGRKDHRDIGMTLFNLGSCLRFRGEMQAAITRFEEALLVYEDIFGSREHKEVARTLDQLGRALMTMERYKEAQLCFSEAVYVYETGEGGRENMAVSTCLYRLGRAMRECGKIVEAIECFEESLDVLDKLEGRDNLNGQNILHQLGISLHANGEDSEAVRSLTEAQRVYKLLNNNQPSQDIAIAISKAKRGKLTEPLRRLVRKNRRRSSSRRDVLEYDST